MNLTTNKNEHNGTAQYLLAVSFVLIAVIVIYAAVANYHGQRAHEKALKDQIHFVSWIFNNMAESGLSQSAMETFSTLTGTIRKDPESEALFLNADSQLWNKNNHESDQSCGINTFMPVQMAFLYDGHSEQFQEVAHADSAASPEFAEWMEKIIKDQPSASNDIRKKLYTDTNGNESLVVFAHSSAISITDRDFHIGFKTDPGNLEHLFSRIWQSQQLLPESFPDNQNNNLSLKVHLATASGQTIFKSGKISDEDVTIRNVLGDQYPYFSGDLAISRYEDSPLLAAGMHEATNWTLLGLFILAISLSLVAFVQFRRESELNRMRSEFVSNVSHELRTPVTQIRMFSETLLNRRDRSREELEKSLKIIDKESKRLSHLITNILDFSKNRHRSLSVSPDIIRPDRIIRETVSAFQPIAEASEATLSIDDLEPGTAFMDSSAFRQVVINILDNAVKYGPAGQTVSISMKNSESGIVLNIADEGPGIPHKIRKKIWKPYWRGEGNAHEVKTGSGIGLAVVRQYIELMNGSANIEDRPGGGTVFCLEFPVNHNPEINKVA